MIDIIRYLGLPYDIHNDVGVNCWGLYKLVKKQEQDIDVLLFKADDSSVSAISRAFEFGLSGRHEHVRTSAPSDFDLVLLRKRRGSRCIYHCGVWFGGKILHAKGSGQTGQVWYEPLTAFNDWHIEYWRHV